MNPSIMIISQKFKYIFPVIGVFFLTLISGCSKEDEKTYWDHVVLSTNTNSLAFMISSSVIPPAGDYGLPAMEKVANGEIDGLDEERFYYMTMYPHVSDPLYNPFAENFLFRYDESGDDSFENYPAFISNLKNYNYELDDFHADVISHQNEISLIQVGNLIRTNNGRFLMYIKLKYLTEFSENHSVAVYVYEKEKIASQETIANGVVQNFVHKNVFLNYATPTQYGTPINGTQAAEQETDLYYEFDYGTKDIKNLGILTVVYKLDSSNQPSGVYTVYRN